MIKILIVDDSKTEADVLTALFNSQKDMEVIGWAKNGEEAISLAQQLKPNLITMDIYMPVMNGFDAIRSIMATNPVPIVVVSSKLNDTEMNATYEALEAGALSVLEKPQLKAKNFKQSLEYMIDTIRSMAEIKVIKRRFATASRSKSTISSLMDHRRNYEIIGIGTSVGGPQALNTILTKLPKKFPVPILVVQHMTKGFIGGFVNWLNDHTPLTIKPAEINEILLPGFVYFAPDNFQLELKREDGNLMIDLVSSEPISGFCPSATALFQSLARVSGKNAVGILLTGMGSDGAQGLLELRKNHGHTIIQDRESSVVFGMAGVAQKLKAVDKIVELDQIADYLISITKK